MDEKDLNNNLCNFRKILINFFKAIDFIQEHFYYFGNLSKSNLYLFSKGLEELIDSIIVNKQFICWSTWQNVRNAKKFQLHYFKFEDLQKTDFSPEKNYRKLDILQDKDIVYLCAKDTKICIKHIRNIYMGCGLSRLITIYKALSHALKEINQKRYCPWCYPDKSLIDPNTRPRKDDDCIEISKFIVKYSKYNSKYLNEHICKIKSKDGNLKETIKLREEELLRIIKKCKVNNSQNDQDFNKNYKIVNDLVKKHYII